MANERIPEDPYRPTFAGDELRKNELRNPALLDNELQPDPELAEGPASSGKIAIFAVGVAVVLGAVFYGLNNSSIKQAGTSPTAQSAAPTSTAQNTAPPSPGTAPPGMRDVTPHAGTAPNSAPGVTTGAAPARPQPPSAAPTGHDAARPDGTGAPSKK
jgi:hypothetical protein